MLSAYDFFSDKIQTCYEGFEPNQTYSHTWGETVFLQRKNNNSDVQYINYKLNNYGHRCDNFKSDHNKKHILFAGCSFTFGEGLGYKENWSGQLYSKLNELYDCDGYFVLGFQNGIISHIIHNMFRYFEQFGNPEIIFCLFPDAVRKVTINEDNKFIIDYKFNDVESAEGLSRAYYSLYFLEKYCEINNIKLYWSSWHNRDSEFYQTLPLKRFFLIDEADILLQATNKDQKTHPLYNIARDKAHPGLRYSNGLANIFYNIFIGENNV